MQVILGISFNKNKSKRIARWIIIILPVCIMTSLIHEPLHRKMFHYETETEKSYIDKTNETIVDIIEPVTKNKTLINTIYRSTTTRYVWCVIHYSSTFVQDYNISILFFHLIVPFLANLLSALIIIFGNARQRSRAQINQTIQEHVRQQLNEHKQLLISPVVLLILSMPRLVISVLPGCVRTSRNLWLYLIAYFFSFTPSVLTFIIFAVPSKLYMKIFRNTLIAWRHRTHRKLKNVK
ncbi:unnamed protein product [Adineta ricciae]|uniref:G-protein coupled receptors family 1 profile domain-containing protein n=1 Tax=Adineta ricciae TaxID=249248 RepID=A0A815SHU8_ADIRI|nr:unnamed protein product [Adineta ricciae]CAF1536540.1 unnamed protein product [Adineta ricciae]